VLANIKSHDTTGLKCVHIRLEDFYKELTLSELLLANEGEYNFDHPNAIDFDLFKKLMIDITNGKSVEIPIYDFANFKRLVRLIRLEETITCDKPDVVIISGLLMLYMKEIRDMFDLKVFTDVDSDTRLSRAVVRDTTQRYNKTLDQVLHGYIKFVKPSFEEFVMHTKKHADVIIPRGDGNLVAIELLSEHIVGLLQK
jgi:uridine kinase